VFLTWAFRPLRKIAREVRATIAVLGGLRKNLGGRTESVAGTMGGD
jgi:hypothetical protein